MSIKATISQTLKFGKFIFHSIQHCANLSGKWEQNLGEREEESAYPYLGHGKIFWSYNRLSYDTSLLIPYQRNYMEK